MILPYRHLDGETKKRRKMSCAAGRGDLFCPFDPIADAVGYAYNVDSIGYLKSHHVFQCGMRGALLPRQYERRVGWNRGKDKGVDFEVGHITQKEGPCLKKRKTKRASV